MVSTVISFWTGVGAAVVLAVPPVQKVDSSACLNRDLLHQKCLYNNVTDVLNYTLHSNTTTATATTATTTVSLSTTTAVGDVGSETNGDDL